MIKKILFTAMFAGAACAAQAQSTGFSITGTIAPSACTISLGGGGVTDFGRIARGSLVLSHTQNAYRPPQQLRMSMAVICPAPTRFALAFIDNQDGTAVVTAGAMPEDRLFGIGTYNGRNIGNAWFHAGGLRIKKTVGGALEPLGTMLMTTGVAGSNSSWESTTWHHFPKGKSIVFASGIATAVDALTEVSGSVSVGVNLDKSVVDAATSEIPFEGRGTVTLVLL